MNTRIRKGIALIATAWIVAGTAQAATPVMLNVFANTLDGKPSVSGVTNLLEGTELMIEVTRSASGYIGQDSVKVRKGRFMSSTFTEHFSALPPGRYALEVLAPLSFTQKEAGAQLGENFSKFSGPLLVRTKLGTVVRYRTNFTVPGMTNSAADSAARTRAKHDREEWAERACAHFAKLTGISAGLKAGSEQLEASSKDCARDETPKR